MRAIRKIIDVLCSTSFSLSDFNFKVINYVDTHTLVKIINDKDNNQDQVLKVVGRSQSGRIRLCSSTPNGDYDELHKFLDEFIVVRKIPCSSDIIVLLSKKQFAYKQFNLNKLSKEYRLLNQQDIPYQNYWGEDCSTLGKFIGKSKSISFFLRD